MPHQENRKDKLIQSRSSSVVISQKFRNIYKKYKDLDTFENYVFCFYEGKDDSKYYNHKIENRSDLRVSHLDFDGKDNFLRLYNILNSKSFYRQSKLLFFIDKDFDEFIKEEKLEELKKIERLYITPCYSIENFYTSKQVLGNILKSEFHLNEIDEEFRKIINLFSLRQKEFHNIFLDINAWIVTQNYFLNSIEKRDIPYSDLYLDKIITISLIEIKVKKSDIIFYLENTLKNSFKISENEVEEKFNCLKERLLSSNHQSNFRGKFELEFMAKFIKLLAEKSNQKDGLGLEFIGINEKIKNEVILNDTLSNLAQYSDFPTCLKEFIDRIEI